MADMMPKVELLRGKYPGLDIEVDGGLSPKTIDAAAKVRVELEPCCTCMQLSHNSPNHSPPPHAHITQHTHTQTHSITQHTHTHTHIHTQAGANMIVSGSAVVKSPEPDKVIQLLRSTVQKYLN